jgi:hypothetical protein
VDTDIVLISFARAVAVDAELAALLAEVAAFDAEVLA